MIKKIDWTIVLLYLSLVAIGLVAIYSTTAEVAGQGIGFSPFYKQLGFIAISLPVLVYLFFVEVRFYEIFSGIFYVAGIILLVGVLFLGRRIGGSLSWYDLGPFSFQPSEVAKISSALFFVRYLSQTQTDIRRYRDLLVALGILALPLFLVSLQPDLGTMIIFLSLALVLFEAGLDKIYLLLIVVIGLAFILALKLGYINTLIIIIFCWVILWLIIKRKVRMNFRRSKMLRNLALCSISMFIMASGARFIYDHLLKEHHRNRIQLWLNLKAADGKESFRQSIGYNTYQSEKAISSGGFTGKGFLQGSRTQGNFIPEQHTDYIISAIGEEWGFLGITVVITLFTLLIMRILSKCNQQKSRFCRFYGYCVAIILFFHYAINVCMVTGLLPTIGIPLPFLSYGGSSFIGFSVLLFIFVRLDASKSEEWMKSS